MPQLRLRERTGRPLCSFCRDDAAPHDSAPCPGCRAIYHHECRDELGGCGTIGCQQQLRTLGSRPVAPRVDDPDRPPRDEVWPHFWLWAFLAWIGFGALVVGWGVAIVHYSKLTQFGPERAIESMAFADQLESFWPWIARLAGVGALLHGILAAVRAWRERQRRRSWREYRARRR